LVKPGGNSRQLVKFTLRNDGSLFALYSFHRRRASRSSRCNARDSRSLPQVMCSVSRAFQCRETRPNTIESLILHMEGEYVINKANPVHFYLLVGNAVRLALRMGLHRDPSKLRSNVTVFQAGKSVLLIMLSLFFILHLNFSPKKSISFTPTPNSQKPLF